jgi:hydroxyacylglutathione hydrolase
MIFERSYLACLAHASFILGDGSSGDLMVVDPKRDVDDYVRRAEALGCKIRYVFLTHFHADFVSGHLELSERVGAEILMGAAAKPDFPFRGMRHGETLDLGRVRCTFLATPGHTPESTCLLVSDRDAKPGTPDRVLTGDTLFVGDVGRPDLLASVGSTAAELGAALFDSLHEKLLKLPPETLVFPAHGAGSLCGKALGDAESTTIGAEKRSNYALLAASRDEFVRLVAKDQTEAPAYFAYDADLNRRRRRTLDAVLKEVLKPLALDDVLRRANQGAQILDVREPDAYFESFLEGSINVGLSGKFASWAGVVLDPKRPIVLIAPEGREREAATRLGRIGFDGVVGYLDGGPSAFKDRPELRRALRRASADDLRAALKSASPPLVLDVRETSEREKGRVEGSLHVSLRKFPAAVRDVPRDRPIVVHCAGGYRSAIAASLLLRDGRKNLVDLRGGFAAFAGGADAAPSCSVSPPAAK